jgi:hypothetical protein
MINQPISRQIQKAVGEAHGPLAITIVLEELAGVFEKFAEELDLVFKEDPEDNTYSTGYRFAANWCLAWAEEVATDNG